MKIKSRNTELPVHMLYPHPDNPRRDVGDVTELAESIRANGIFQNLTVVTGGKGAPDSGYTVIIGHRRLAAAKAAGLKYVPCMVVEMDEREQAATMLLENMQRADLTIFEQAQGFQMMLDLGETQDGIAEKTGFSKTTIRHRLKLLELDPAEFAKAQERQATFSDYIELEKIKDPVNKTEALKTIGTSSFKWKVEQLIKRENAAENADYRRYVKEHPESVILAMLCTIYEGSKYRIALHDFHGKYQRNRNLEIWYSILKSVGYRMSDDENALLSGEHECFKNV